MGEDKNLWREFDTMLAATRDDPKLVQEFCEMQRSNRNEKFKQKMLDQNFEGVKTDNILINVLNKPGYLDLRNNLCVWARPTESIKKIVGDIQDELRASAPNIWLMPLLNLHMTVLEIIHSETPEVVASGVQKLQPFISHLANYTLSHRTKLVKPKLSFDDMAVALTFVPAAGESSNVNDNYTYLHLRRDLFCLCRRNGVKVEARYATTSCHITIARFISTRDHASETADGVAVPSHEKLKSWIFKLEHLNDWLQERHWHEGSEWYVGEERGLEIRKGRLWYGGGHSVEVGKGY